MKEDFLDKRKIITMAKDLKEAAGIMVYPREDDSIDLSSFIVKKPPQKESVVLEIPLPEKVVAVEEEQTGIPEETIPVEEVVEEEQTDALEETMPVEEVAEEEVTEEKQIERIMDGLLDFCDEQRFLKLYKELCRHIFDRYPQLVGEHISIYRSLFESE